MDEDLENIIRDALNEARDRGCDLKGQGDHAALAVHSLRPDLSALDILKAINLVRWFIRPRA